MRRNYIDKLGERLAKLCVASTETTMRRNEDKDKDKDKDKDSKSIREISSDSPPSSRDFKKQQQKKKKDAQVAYGPNPAFEKAMEESPFDIFKCIADLGYFGWTPTGKNSYKRLRDVSTADILKGIEPNVKPPKAVPIPALNRQLPKPFLKLPPREHENRFPYDSSFLVPLYVATLDRNVALDEVQFMLGGSTLQMLATMTIPDDCSYLVTNFPGTNVILVAKHSEHTKNSSDPGYRFERFVIGKRFDDNQHNDGDNAIIEHMQMMDICGHRVLFAANSDALDDDDNPAEIKSSNPRYWGSKVMFQMISNGSVSLYAGSKRSRPALELVRVRRLTLNAVIEKALEDVKDDFDVSDLEENILCAMDILTEASESGRISSERVLEIRFHGQDMMLRRYDGRHDVLLPPAEVVKDVLSS